MPLVYLFFFNDTATTEIYTLSLHDALPISVARGIGRRPRPRTGARQESRHADDDNRGHHRRRDFDAGQFRHAVRRSEEHTSELQSLRHLVCRLLLEKKK